VGSTTAATGSDPLGTISKIQQLEVVVGRRVNGIIFHELLCAGQEGLERRGRAMETANLGERGALSRTGEGGLQ